MAEKRNDAWDELKDQILLDTVLTHIRTGSTQLKAFEEVGEKVGKTSAACGFRWNNHVRKINIDAVKKAKSEAKNPNNKKNGETPAPVSSKPLTQSTKPPSKKLSVLIDIKSQTEQLADLVSLLEAELNQEKDNSVNIESKYKKLKKDYDEVVSFMAKYVKQPTT